MKFRRHQAQRFGWARWFGWTTWFRRLLRTQTGRKRQLAIGAAGLAATFLVGYGFAAIVIFPAPIFASSQKIPRVLGLSLAEAQRLLDETDLVVNDTDAVNHPAAPRGVVVWQDPPPGVAVPKGTGVTLSVSLGPQRVPVPDVTEYEQGLAQRLIVAAGLRVARIDTSQAPVPRGVVVNTRPPAGTTLLPGTGVILFVSVGAPTISVPDLTGMTLDEAREALEESGLVLGSTRTRRTTTRPPGSIIEQNPAAGTLSAPGAAVNVTLVRGGRL